METQPSLVGRQIEVKYNKYNQATNKYDIPHTELGELLAIMPDGDEPIAIYKEKETLKMCSIRCSYVRVLD